MATVQRKLTDLKRFDSEFQNAVSDLVSSGVIINGQEINCGKSVSDFKKSVDSSLKSIKDRIAGNHATRVAIAKSNTTTEISIGDKKMTILEALIFKQYQIPLLKALLSELKSQEYKNKRIFSNKLQESEKSYKDLAATPNIKKETLDELSERNKPILFTLEDEIAEMTKQIEFYEREFDSVLSEINATTQIDL